MGLFDRFKKETKPNAPNNHPDYGEVAKKLTDVTIQLMKEKNGGVRVEDAVAFLGTVVAERSIEAAGDYSIYDHDKAPGKRVFSENVNVVLFGDQVSDDVNELSAESVYGQMRDFLKSSPIPPDDLPPVKSILQNFASGIGKPEDWGKCPWTVPAGNLPTILPLRAGYETRGLVDQILDPVPAKTDKLKVCVQALCILLVMAKDAIDPKIALLLAWETINGMAKTAPMTAKAFKELAANSGNA